MPQPEDNASAAYRTSAPSGESKAAVTILHPLGFGHERLIHLRGGTFRLTDAGQCGEGNLLPRVPRAGYSPASASTR